MLDRRSPVNLLSTSCRRPGQRRGPSTECKAALATPEAPVQQLQQAAAPAVIKRAPRWLPCSAAGLLLSWHQLLLLLKYQCRADRVATVERRTKETSVSVTLNLDGTGQCEANTGIPFLDHMLDVRPMLETAAGPGGPAGCLAQTAPPSDT